MFCGLPVIVAALPMFDAVASASRYGSGRCRRAHATSSTIGVNTRQIVSLTKSADSTPDTSDQRDEQAPPGATIDVR